MKKILLLVPAIFLFFSLQSNVFAQQDDKAKHILDAMSANYQKITAFKAKFKYELNSPADGVNEVVEGKISVKGDKYYIDLGEQVIYNNHETVWTYIKEAKEVTITTFEADANDLTPTQIPNMYKTGFKFMYLQEEKIDGQVYDVVDLTPEDKNVKYYKIRLLIHKSSKTVYSWKIFEKSGRRYNYTIQDFQPNASIPDTDFVFEPKQFPGVSVVDLR